MNSLLPLIIFSWLIFFRQNISIDFNNPEFSSKYAIPDENFEPSYFKLFLNSDSLIIESDGKCDKLNFKLNVDSCCWIESLQYFQTDSINVYFLIVETDADMAGSKIIRYDLSKNKEIWHAYAGGFNAHNFIVYEKCIYLNSIGFLGKLNMKTGEYFWMHDDLYEKYKANHFLDVIIKKDTIEGIFYRDINSNWKIILDRDSGKIIKIIKKGV